MKIGSAPHPARQDINLVDLMDGCFRLYAPVMLDLLKGYPEAHGVHTFIGRDKPLAIPADENDQGYYHFAFVEEARRKLEPLVTDTMALQESCAMTRGRHEPVSVTAHRVGEGMKVQVTVSNRLGGVHALRIGRAVPSAIEAFFLLPPRLVITAKAEEPEMREVLQDAVACGLEAVIEKVIEKGVMLNGDFEEASSLRTWAAAFPNDGKATCRSLVGDYVSIVSKSNYRPVVIMASESSFDSATAKFEGNVVEPLKYSGNPEAATSP